LSGQVNTRGDFFNRFDDIDDPVAGHVEAAYLGGSYRVGYAISVEIEVFRLRGHQYVGHLLGIRRDSSDTFPLGTRRLTGPLHCFLLGWVHRAMVGFRNDPAEQRETGLATPAFREASAAAKMSRRFGDPRRNGRSHEKTEQAHGNPLHHLCAGYDRRMDPSRPDTVKRKTETDQAPVTANGSPSPRGPVPQIAGSMFHCPAGADKPPVSCRLVLGAETIDPPVCRAIVEWSRLRSPRNASPQRRPGAHGVVGAERS
jgi:hypothetical protein